VEKRREILDAVAENPGCSAQQLDDILSEIDSLAEKLSELEHRNEVICVNDTYWIVRRGRYSFEDYDHKIE
jgi:predicted transcriptional regulator